MYRRCSNPKCGREIRPANGPDEGPSCHAAMEVELEPSDVIGPFNISGTARRRVGGMSAVYEARMDGHKGDIALKVTHTDWFEALRNEVAVLREMDHSNIIRVIPIPEGKGTLGKGSVPKAYVDGEPKCFVALEWMEGGSLKDVLSRKQWLGWARAVGIISQVGAALSYAHAKGKMHLDIKPGNILLSENGERAVLSDFGIAKDVDYSPKGKRRLGTLPYMSPEQALGRRLDPRSDIYSLASVLYEMLTGFPPFTGSSTSSVRRSIIQVPLIPPSKLPPSRRLVEVPPAVEEVLLKAMEKNPISRYQTVDAFISDLRKVAPRSRHKSVPRPRPEVRKEPRPIPWLWILGVIAIVLGLLGLFLVLVPMIAAAACLSAGLPVC